MPEITVKGMPLRCGQKKLRKVCREIMRAVAGVKKLEIDENQISCFFPLDRMRWDFGEGICITVSKLFFGPEYPKRDQDTLDEIAEVIVNVIKPFFPNSKVECSAEPLDRRQTGFAVRD